MDARTAKALEDSIKHWEQNVAAEKLEDTKIGPENCALCGLFNMPHAASQGTSCVGCPVMDRTGQNFCKGSPYDQVELADDARDFNAFRAAAQRELDFLKSLREPQP
jgi:hypothetical protein